jgi:hypothetical protein
MDPLALARKKRAEMAQRGEKIVRRNPLEKLAEKPGSLRRAINARCYQCESEDLDPAVRWRIGNCLATGCALWAVRPFQTQYGRPEPKSMRL